MNAEEFQLACRAVAVGVPVESYDVIWNQVRLSDELGRRVILDVGDTYDCNRLRYVVAMDKGNIALLPLLSDPSWTGWVLEEVERRGFTYELCAYEPEGWHRVLVAKASGPAVHTRVERGRPAALVAMLEATWSE